MCARTASRRHATAHRPSLDAVVHEAHSEVAYEAASAVTVVDSAVALAEVSVLLRLRRAASCTLAT